MLTTKISYFSGQRTNTGNTVEILVHGITNNGITFPFPAEITTIDGTMILIMGIVCHTDGNTLPHQELCVSYFQLNPINKKRTNSLVWDCWNLGTALNPV